MFLQFEALRAIEEMAGIPTQFLMFPFSKSGNSPVIMMPDTTKITRTTMHNRMIFAVVLVAACTNPEVPQGFEG